MTTAERPVRWAALDGLRAVAVAAVSLFHLFAAYTPSWNPLRPSGGYLGVDMFFVLSGFLITSILLTEVRRWGRVSVRAFYIRRALRLFPALAVLLVVAGIVAAIFTDQYWSRPTLLGLPWVVLYLANWNAVLYGGRLPLGAIGHTWSLAVEEQFYVLWPLILTLVVARFKNRSRVALVLVVVAVAEMAYRYLALEHLGFGFQRVYFGTDTSSDGLLLGCALAFYLDGRSWRPFSPRVARAVDAAAVGAVVALVLLVMRMPVFSDGGIWFGVSAAVICTTVIVLNLVTRPFPALASLLGSPPLVWVGKRSYGIYLWVTAAIYLVQPLGTHGLGIYPYNALVLLAGVAMAALSYRFVELPFLRLKGRFERVRSLPVAAATEADGTPSTSDGEPGGVTPDGEPASSTGRRRGSGAPVGTSRPRPRADPEE